jgi:hydroxymethylbilane synthase
METIRIGTRGSKLALLQTGMVREALRAVRPGMTSEVCVMKTTGDILSDAPLDVIGGKGVFVKEIERALLASEIDCAVHSLKDMQAVLPEGLVNGAYLLREDPRDMLFSKGNYSLETLPAGFRIGTSSMRRRCQLKTLRPDIEIVEIRGNVPTRLGKVGVEVDGVILAAAGVKRLGLKEGIALDPRQVVPSPGQGIIAVECRESDARLTGLLAKIDHLATRVCAEAERSFLAALGQDCNLPAGAYATHAGGIISLFGMLGSPDEACIERMHLEGTDASIGRHLALALKEKVRTESLP